MIDPAGIPDFDEPIAAHARKDLPLLRASMSVQEALDQIRREGVGERVIYFYAVDADARLAAFYLRAVCSRRRRKRGSRKS